jgi:hypothetical protein
MMGLMRLSCSHPVLLRRLAEPKASAMTCNALYEILINSDPITFSMPASSDYLPSWALLASTTGLGARCYNPFGVKRGFGYVFRG